MPTTKDRKDLIKQLEAKLGAKILTLVTGDRQGMETRIAPDILSLVSEHLAFIKPAKDLALFLYTPGGDTIVGWGLVNLLRQYCKRFSVLVPFRALSCGTLIALGADSIVMGRHGLLSPVDPSVSSPFNPSVPGGQPGVLSLLPVSVEDMIGFLDLARKEIGLKN
jgi:ClpP class serine protease